MARASALGRAHQRIDSGEAATEPRLAVAGAGHGGRSGDCLAWRYEAGWVHVLHVAMAALWLVIGVSDLLRSDAGFVPIAATLSGMLGMAAAYLDRRARRPL